METSPKRTRRNFTAAEKLRILVEADACSARGELEALMRCEGIYRSHLSDWRAQRKAGGSKRRPRGESRQRPPPRARDDRRTQAS